MKTTKCLALMSGGLDSMLAAKLMVDQGIYVEGINFYIGFAGDCPNDSPNHIKTFCSQNCLKKDVFTATKVADAVGIKLNIVNVVEEYKAVLFNPKYGYGANINPCLDCKTFMVNAAKKYMEENGFDFLVTGEVIGQRPMSQRKDTMPIVAKNLDDKLLRPLCAKILKPTLPERENWVNRDLLMDFSGRNRKPQMELAAKLGFKEYPQPAGGCLLTDPNYCKRLKHLWEFKQQKAYSLDDIMLLKVGRHLQPFPHFKLIIGRDEDENNFLENYKNKYIAFESEDFPGALVLLSYHDDSVTAGFSLRDFEFAASHNNPVAAGFSLRDFEFAAKIAAYFSKGKLQENVKITVTIPDSENKILHVKPFAVNEILSEWYI